MLRSRFKSRVSFVDNFLIIMGLTGFTYEEHWNRNTVIVNTSEEEFRSIYKILKDAINHEVDYSLSEKIMYDEEENRHFFYMRLINGHYDEEEREDYSWDKAKMRVALEIF